MAAQRSNSVLVFAAVLVGAIIVVYAIVGRSPSTPEEEQLPEQAEPAHAQPAAQPPEEDPITEIDQTTDTTAPPVITDGSGGQPAESEAPPTLMEAAAAGNLGVITAMIAAGADLDAPDENGRTPLMAAAGGGHVDAVFALLNAGAKLDLRDNERRSARDYALARYDQNGQTIARVLGEAAGPPPVRDPADK